MLEDEERHGENALNAGGMELPEQVKTVMSQVAKLMTGSTYWI